MKEVLATVAKVWYFRRELAFGKLVGFLRVCMGVYVDRVVLVRVGELSVKRGWTRKEMERLLLSAMKEAAEECGGAKIAWEPGRFYAWGDVKCLKRVLSRVFGVKSVSPTYLVRFSNLDGVADAAARLWGDVVRGRGFAVRVHRWGIHNFTSLDAAAKIGAALVSAGGKVDLERPEVELCVEIRGRRAFLYTEVLEGPGGLPLGSEGKVLALVSGGIDSPVAAWMMMRRGAHVDVFYCNLGGDSRLEARVGGDKDASVLVLRLQRPRRRGRLRPPRQGH